jgi:fibronectin type III domain protein
MAALFEELFTGTTQAYYEGRGWYDGTAQITVGGGDGYKFVTDPTLGRNVMYAHWATTTSHAGDPKDMGVAWRRAFAADANGATVYVLFKTHNLMGARFGIHHTRLGRGFGTFTPPNSPGQMVMDLVAVGPQNLIFDVATGLEMPNTSGVFRTFYEAQGAKSWAAAGPGGLLTDDTWYEMAYYIKPSSGSGTNDGELRVVVRPFGTTPVTTVMVGINIATALGTGTISQFLLALYGATNAAGQRWTNDIRAYFGTIRLFAGDAVTSGEALPAPPPPPAPPAPPTAPTALTAAAVSPSQISLSWTDNATSEDGFRIERCAGVGCTGFAEIATVGANVVSYQNTGLTPSTSYSYRVRAYNTGGASSYTNTATAVTLTPPPAPPPPAPPPPAPPPEPQVLPSLHGLGFRRLEVWSDLQCAGGARLAAIPDRLALEDTRKLAGGDELRLTLPVSSVAYASLLERRVIRVVYADDTFDEWRLTGIDEQEGPQGRVGLVTALGPSVDLARVVVGRTEANGAVYHDFEIIGMAPAEYLATILLPALVAEGYDYYAAGAIETTLPVDLVHEWDTALAVCQRLADLTGTEFQLRRNGATQYLIDLVALTGFGASTVYVTLGKNLRGVQRQRASVDQATRVYARGMAEDAIRPSMARARWEVVSVTGSVVRLKDPAGGDGPVQCADQLTGCYLRTTSGTITAITDSAVVSAAQSDVTVVSATGISAGHLLELRRNDAGADVTFLEHPADKAAYGLIAKVLDRPDIPGVDNVVGNPAMRIWTGAASAAPDNWTKLSTPTLTRTTTPARWRVGGKSCRVQSTADGQGLETNYVTVTPSLEKPFFSGFLSLWIDSGQVRVELVATDGVTTWVIPEGTENKASSNERNVWVDLGVAGIDLKALGTGVTQVKLRIVQDGAGTADVYVDSGQLVNEAGQQPFYEGTGATRLWQAANEDLLAHSRPEVRIDVDLLDLARLHPTVWPDDALVLGGNVRVQDSALGVDVTTRVLQITRDLLLPATTKVVLSNRPDDLTDALIRPRKAPRKNRLADLDPRELSVEALIEAIAGPNGGARVQLSARPAGTTIFYVVQTFGTTPPVIGAASWNAYLNVFTVKSSTSALQVAAYATLGGRFSQVRVWRVGSSEALGAPPIVGEAPALTAKIRWRLVGDAVEALIFRKKGGWPTIGGASTDPLDFDRLVRRQAAHLLSNGVAIIGPQEYTDAEVYAAGNECFVIGVAIDKNGRVAERSTVNFTLANAVSKRLTTMTAARTTDGSSCASRAQVTLTWTNSAAIAAGDYLEIRRSVNLGPYTLVLSQTNPTSPTSKVDTLPDYYSAGSNIWLHVRYEWEIRSGGGGGARVDEGSLDVTFPISGACPL